MSSYALEGFFLVSVMVAAVVTACAESEGVPDGKPDAGGFPSYDSGGGFQDPDTGSWEPQEDGGDPETDGGTGADGGGGDRDGGAGGTGPFAGAPEYKRQLGKTSRNAGHANGAFGDPNPAGTGCLGCHDGITAKPKFLFGGTIYSDPVNKIPASRVEVRLVVENAATSTYSDGDGNFYAIGEAHKGGGSTGVRDATDTKLMGPSPFNGNCNGCHNGASQSRIHIP